MGAHIWMGIGVAEFTSAQAEGWGKAAHAELTKTEFTMNIGKVVCLRCGEAFPDALSECVRPAQVEPHNWVATTTVMMTEDEALAWMRSDEAPVEGQSPKVTNVMCALCGAPYEEAAATCGEQDFWR